MRATALRVVAIITFAAFPLASCAFHSPSQPPPGWFLTPPLHDAAKLYGAGAGATVEDAAKEALNQIASTLSVTVSSRWEKSETERVAGGAAAYDKEIRSNLQSRVGEIKFNNYQVLRNQMVGQKCYVLVAVDKEVLLAEKMRNLATADSMIENIYQAAQQKGIVERLRDFEVVAMKVAQAVPLVNLISSLDPSFESEKYLGRYDRYLADGRNAWSDLRVFLVQDNFEADDVVPVVKEFLNSASITVAPDFDGDAQHLVVLTIRAERKEMELYGSKAVKLLTLFEVRDTSQRLIASSRLESAGHSTISFREAGKAASLDLEGKIKKRGLVSVLGINKTRD